MSLTPRSRLGPYEIISLLGAGGMGEVWLANDTTLDRELAIKLLPAAFTSDSERLARGLVPVEESLAIARQIEEALEYAHDRAIVTAI